MQDIVPISVLHRYLDFPYVVGAGDKAHPHTHSLQYQHWKRPLQVVAVNQKVHQDWGNIYFVFMCIYHTIFVWIHLLNIYTFRPFLLLRHKTLLLFINMECISGAKPFFSLLEVKIIGRRTDLSHRQSDISKYLPSEVRQILLVISSEITGLVFLSLRAAKLSQNSAMKTKMHILSSGMLHPSKSRTQSSSHLCMKQTRWPVMLPRCAPSNSSACVTKSISPSSSTAGPVQHAGRAKLILTEGILQATTPNQWHATEQKA